MQNRHCFILFLTYLLLITICSSATIIRIQHGEHSIGDAVRNAKRGDTILLQRGYYSEHDIVVDKKLAIMGEGMVVIDAGNRYQGFIIMSDSVLIQGLQIQQTGRSSMIDMAGIKVINAAYVTIRNNRLINNTYGVYLQQARHCYVTGNIIHSTNPNEINSGNGIHAWKCERLLLAGNIISGQRDGIYFEFVTNSSIVANLSFNNIRYGLHFMFSHDNGYKKNCFKTNGAGVAVMYSRGVIMEENEFVYNWGDASYGLLLKEITDSKIVHNRFVKNTIGAYMEGTTRVDFRYNIFQDNGWALRVQASCSNSNFTWNNFIGNSFDVATNGSLVLSTFNNNYWDKYDGYDLDRDGIGDVPYYPVSVYAVIAEKIPAAMILYHSLLTDIVDQVEKVMPTLIPDKLKDNHPLMKKLNND